MRTVELSVPLPEGYTHVRLKGERRDDLSCSVEVDYGTVDSEDSFIPGQFGSHRNLVISGDNFTDFVEQNRLDGLPRGYPNYEYHSSDIDRYAAEDPAVREARIEEARMSRES